MKLKIWSISLVFLFVSLPFLLFAAEEITITTYYPSPYGSYRELRANRMMISSTITTRTMPTTDGTLFWGDYRGELNVGNGASLKLGGNGNPYIAFYNDMNASSNPVTISLSGSSLKTTGDFIIGGIAYMRGDSVTKGCLMLTYGGNSGYTICPNGYEFNRSLSGSVTNVGGIMYCCKT